MRMSKVKAFTSIAIERWAQKHLDGHCVVVTDAFF